MIKLFKKREVERERRKREKEKTRERGRERGRDAGKAVGGGKKDQDDHDDRPTRTVPRYQHQAAPPTNNLLVVK